VLPDALRERGIDVEVLELYDTIAEPLAPRTLAAAREASYVTFTSSSTVRCFSNALDGAALSPATRVVSIGPLTSAALRERGIEPHVEARRHDIDGLIDALLRDSSARVTQGPPHGAGINRARGCLGDE
jgi:uroporphyrinogen-III synthase